MATTKPRLAARSKERVAVEERALDVLSDVLGFLRLRGEVLCRSELSAPWGLSFHSDEAHFHVIESGRCLLQVASSSETSELSGGDLVVLPHGSGHRLFDEKGSRVVPVMSVLDTRRKRASGMLRFGGGGAETRILCGRFRFDASLRSSTLAGLPDVLRIEGASGRPPEWLDLTMRFLAAEAHSVAPGRELAMSRLVDLLFVQAIRYWIALDESRPLGWIGALRDPRIGAALARMHGKPAHHWDVGTLAAEVGMSRSSFAQRFVDLVGDPPSKYLARWRVHLGARLLRSPGATVAKTAERVGYESEAAFSRVFKRFMRVAPAAYREQHAARR
jgi:AraC-like DNA-binding protein